METETNSQKIEDKLSIEDLRRLTKAKSAQPLPKKEMIALMGKDIELYHVLVHPVSIVDEDTGEVKNTFRVVLEIGPDKFLAFVSDSAIEFARLLEQYKPSLNFEGKLKFRFFEVSTRRGYRTFTFEVV